MWKTVKSLKPSELLARFQVDQHFHASHKQDLLFWSKGNILRNIKQAFHEIIPQNKLVKWLEEQRPRLKACFPSGQIERYELVGSTSVPGMCGMMSPDICFFVRTFPPSDETIEKLEDVGYKLAGYYNIEDAYDDIWFLKRYEFWDEGGINIGSNLHIWKKGSTTASKLIGFRDLLRNNRKAFEQYRSKKLERMSKDVVTNDDYSIYKLGKVQVANQYLKNFR